MTATICLLLGAVLVLAGRSRRLSALRLADLRRRNTTIRSGRRVSRDGDAISAVSAVSAVSAGAARRARPAGSADSSVADGRRRIQAAVLAAVSAGALPWVLWSGPVAAAASVVAALIAGFVARRLWSRAGRGPTSAAGVPLTLDLLAAALRAGCTPVTALRTVARAAAAPHDELLHRVATLLSLGATPGEAWAAAEVDPAWRVVARTAIRSDESGLRLAESWEKLAGDLRADLRASAAARAERVGVLGLLPLAACFLPAFVCLGVVPVVAGLAGSVLHR